MENDLLTMLQTAATVSDTTFNSQALKIVNKPPVENGSVFTDLIEKYKPAETIDIPSDFLEAFESCGNLETDKSQDAESSASSFGINKTSAVGPFAGILGGIIDFFDGDTKDGKIGDTKQGATGDCWLLSGVNALSYTEEGRNMISDAIEYGDDGLIRVHLKGVESVCVIYPEDIAATKGSSQYSSGDDDMIILELAIERTLDDIAQGRIALDSSTVPWFIEGQGELTATTLGNSSIEGGYTTELIYLLTGKVGEYSNDKDKKEEFLNNFQKNGNKDYALGASCPEETEVKDVNGQIINLAGPHAYAVKSVDGDTVTITNPWDSGEEIVLSRETFLNTFGVYGCDLSENNPVQHFSSKTCTIDKDGNWVYTFNHPESEDGYYGVDYKVQQEVYKDGRLIKSVSKNEDGTIGRVKTYYQNGKVDSDNYYGDNGKLRCSFEYDENGNKTSEMQFFENGVMSSKSDYDENGIKEKETHYTENGFRTNEFCYDEKGNLKFETTFGKYGKKESEIEYGLNGSKTAETKYDSEGRKQSRYEYDEKGHITREIKYDENGNIESITRYTKIN